MSQQSFCDLHLLGQMSSGVGQPSVWALDQNTPVGGLALLAKLLPICSRLVASLNRYNRKNNYPTEKLSSTRSKRGSCWSDLTYNLQLFYPIPSILFINIRNTNIKKIGKTTRKSGRFSTSWCDYGTTRFMHLWPRMHRERWVIFFFRCIYSIIILRCQFLFTTSKYAQQWMRQVWRQEIHFI